MSSTRKRPKGAVDYYVTPQWAIDQALAALWDDQDLIGFSFRKPLTVLDPCAGGDAGNDMAYPSALARWREKHGLDMHVTTVDVRPDSRADIKADYITDYNHDLHNVVITNPPFSLALPVIQKALASVVDGGIVVMLLRLNFFGSQERSQWFKQNMPTCFYVHSKRMNFGGQGSGGTDSIEYMHCVWVKGQHPRTSWMRIL